MRLVTDAERRARLVRRQGLGHGFTDLTEASGAIVAWHATEAATVHLAAWARVRDLELADVDSALYLERSLVKQLAMRRTLFAFPRDLIPAVWGSASARVAETEAKRLAKEVVSAGIGTDGEQWVQRASAATMALLSDGKPRTAAEIRAHVPELTGRMTIGSPDKKWGGEFPIAPRLLTLLGARGSIVRAENAGHWRLNKPTWIVTSAWLGDAEIPLTPASGYLTLVRRWLATYGPGTEDDLVWWFGATKASMRAVLAELGAVPVSLEAGTGWVLPDDVEPEPPGSPVAVLLPTLDPSVMGWKHRDFYLDPGDRPFLFDSNGNAGTTAWWDGRIVGCWVQDDAGAVRVILRDGATVGESGRTALDNEAERLTGWLNGVRVQNVYASPQMRAARLP